MARRGININVDCTGLSPRVQRAFNSLTDQLNGALGGVRDDIDDAGNRGCFKSFTEKREFDITTIVSGGTWTAKNGADDNFDSLTSSFAIGFAGFTDDLSKLFVTDSTAPDTPRELVTATYNITSEGFLGSQIQTTTINLSDGENSVLGGAINEAGTHCALFTAVSTTVILRIINIDDGTVVSKTDVSANFGTSIKFPKWVGDYLFVGDGDELVIYNLTTLSSPSQESRTTVSNTGDNPAYIGVALENPNIIFFGSDGEFYVFDVTDKGSPTENQRIGSTLPLKASGNPNYPLGATDSVIVRATKTSTTNLRVVIWSFDGSTATEVSDTNLTLSTATGSGTDNDWAMAIDNDRFILVTGDSGDEVEMIIVDISDTTTPIIDSEVVVDASDSATGSWPVLTNNTQSGIAFKHGIDSGGIFAFLSLGSTSSTTQDDREYCILQADIFKSEQTRQPPLEVESTKTVINLDSDTVDGLHDTTIHAHIMSRLALGV